MQVEIQIRNVYGNEKAYPVNDTAFAVARIANTKTLTRAALAGVLQMGLPIVEVDRYGRVCRRFESLETATLPMVD